MKGREEHLSAGYRENVLRDASREQSQNETARRLPDRCGICGRFVGRYPVGFYCDRHCYACICSDCPGVDGNGVYRVVLDA